MRWSRINASAALETELTWKLGLGLGVGSQVERGFSWERKGPLNAWVMALRLKAHTADAAILLLYRERDSGENSKQKKHFKLKCSEQLIG